MLGLLAEAALRSVLLALVVGLALRLRRGRNPRVSLVAWTLVLAASLSMLVTIQLASIALPHGLIRVAGLPLTSGLTALMQFIYAAVLAAWGAAAAQAGAQYAHWTALSIYVAVFGVLLLRLLIGLARSCSIVRQATPIREDWVGDFKVLMSRHIDAPATLGSMILLPRDHTAWTTAKRVAVMAHEGSHVVRHDYAIQLAAAVNRIVFWFNPFAWWLQRHLSELAEAASDDAAIARLNDRLGYAAILLELSGRVASLPSGVAMARRSAVTARIERILSGTPLSRGVSAQGRAMMTACFIPLAVLMSAIVVSPTPSSLATAIVLSEESDITSEDATLPPPDDAHATEWPRMAAPLAILIGADMAPAPASTITGVESGSRLPFFKRLVDATCAATEVLRFGPAFPNPANGSSFLTHARFFRSRNGNPWMVLYCTGGQSAVLPVKAEGA